MMALKEEQDITEIVVAQVHGKLHGKEIRNMDLAKMSGTSTSAMGETLVVGKIGVI